MQHTKWRRHSCLQRATRMSPLRSAGAPENPRSAHKSVGAVRLITLALLAFTAASLYAQPIQYIEARKLLLLTTAANSYAMGVDPNGELQHLYWGAPLWRADDVPTAAPRREMS